MKVIIAGGRNYKFVVKDIAALNHLHSVHGFTEVVSGGAKGADAQGEDWAAFSGVPRKRFSANW